MNKRFLVSVNCPELDKREVTYDFFLLGPRRTWPEITLIDLGGNKHHDILKTFRLDQAKKLYSDLGMAIYHAENWEKENKQKIDLILNPPKKEEPKID